MPLLNTQTSYWPLSPNRKQKQINKRKRIAIVTGGGDAPGMNAAVRGAARAARNKGWEVYAIRDGYRSLLTGGENFCSVSIAREQPVTTMVTSEFLVAYRVINPPLPIGKQSD